MTPNVPGPGTDELDAGPPEMTALCVDDDGNYLSLLSSRLGRVDGVEVRTETDPSAALGRLDEADCVVSDYAMPTMDGLALLDAVRETAPRLPFVLLTGCSDPDVAATVLSRPRTDYLQKSSVATSGDLLAARARSLVGWSRAATLSRRALAALETVTDGVAIAGPGGRFRVVDPAFACRFDREEDALVGTPWRAVFADDAVDRMESSGLSAVEDGWRWSDTCIGRRADGTEFPVATTVAGLEDGSLVFVVSGD